MWTSGCPPLIDIDRFYNEKAKGCDLSNRPFFRFLTSQKSKESTVIITGRYSLYVEGTFYGDVEENNVSVKFTQIRDTSVKVINPIKNQNKDVFKNGLIKTLSELSKSFDNIIIVLDAPELGFSPRTCINRPFKLTQKECLLSKKTVLLRQSQSRNIIHDVALEFPQVRIYDPIDIFCNASNCYPMRKGVMLYRDDDHISVDASKIIITDMRQKKLIP
jgi:hypothetical protein